MKIRAYISLLLCFVTLVFSLTACNIGTKQVKDKSFSSNGFSITLTNEFKKVDVSDAYNACFESETVGVTFFEEDPQRLMGEHTDFESVTLKAYARVIIRENSLPETTEIIEENGITYFTYTREVSNTKFVYFCPVFKSDETFWLLNFYTFSSHYEKLKPKFLEWSATFKAK